MKRQNHLFEVIDNLTCKLTLTERCSFEWKMEKLKLRCRNKIKTAILWVETDKKRLTWNLDSELLRYWHRTPTNKHRTPLDELALAHDNQLANPKFYLSNVAVVSNILQSECLKQNYMLQNWSVPPKNGKNWNKQTILTIILEAVRGWPNRSHFWLWKCQWTSVARPIPIGVHFKNTLRHVSQPPAANNHQSIIDKIVQPAPAFHPHDFRIRFNLLNLPFFAIVDVDVVVFVSFADGFVA